MSTNSKPKRYFSTGLSGDKGAATMLLRDYPMSITTKNAILENRVKAANIILSNQVRGDHLKIRNIEKERSRTVLLNVLNHLVKHNIISRNTDTMKSSEIRFQPMATLYLPERIVYTPEYQIYYKLNSKERRSHMNLDTPEKKELAKRMLVWWEYIEQQEISPNLNKEAFTFLNQYQTVIRGKKPLKYPEPEKKKPYFSFNNKEMTKGGRMYGAWWIGTSKLLRKRTIINGELTSDVDGRGMHVQLLYRVVEAKFPDHDPYVYDGDDRSIAKGLMLLMMNTKKCYADLPSGRNAVAYTYARSTEFPCASREKLFAMMRRLEQLHEPIKKYFYRSNWGHLQMLEAQIMMRIMEAGMKQDIPILPVHDGCLCPRSKNQDVIKLFSDEGIEAVENKKHLVQLPIEDIKQLLRQTEKLKITI